MILNKEKQYISFRLNERTKDRDKTERKREREKSQIIYRVAFSERERNLIPSFLRRKKNLHNGQISLF